MPRANPAKPSLKAKKYPAYHLMRVLVHKRVFDRLDRIAKAESDRAGQYVSISDIVRVATADWLNAYDSAVRLGALQPPIRTDGDGAFPLFKPS